MTEILVRPRRQIFSATSAMDKHETNARLLKNLTVHNTLAVLYFISRYDIFQNRLQTKSDLLECKDWQAYFKQLKAPQELFRLNIEVDLELEVLQTLLTPESRLCILTLYFRFIGLKDSYPAYLDDLLLKWFPHLKVAWAFLEVDHSHSEQAEEEASEDVDSEAEVDITPPKNSKDLYKSSLFELVDNSEGHFFRFFTHLDPENKKKFALEFCNHYKYSQI